jgi:hypothetical protein
MSKTIIRDGQQTNLPANVCEAAELRPSDQVDWRFENGEIRGRKVAGDERRTLDLDDVDANTLLPKGATLLAEGILAAVREDREGR